jgi:hypothetical protein
VPIHCEATLRESLSIFLALCEIDSRWFAVTRIVEVDYRWIGLAMNADEKLVFDHLTSRGFTIQREPEGPSTTPDFLVDEKAALEVRRLNLNYAFKDGSTEGLEVGRIPFRKHLETLLESLGEPKDGQSWSVYFRIKGRPIGKTKKIKSAIREWADAHSRNPEEAGELIEVGTTLNLRIYPYGDGKQ